MTEIDDWDAETERLDFALARRRGQREAAAPGSELHQRRQHEADRVSYRLSAYEQARPVLVGLYRELSAREADNNRRARYAADDASMWTWLAGATGVLAGLCLLLWVWLMVWWLLLVVILSVVACVVAVGASVASHRDRPDTAACAALDARIAAIRKACAECDSPDGLDHVEALLHPRRPGNLPARLL